MGMTASLTEHVMQEAHCPWCGRLANRASNSDTHNTAPVDGDATICIGCGEWSIFEGDQLRTPTVDEFIEIGTDKDCQLARRAWALMDRERNRG